MSEQKYVFISYNKRRRICGTLKDVSDEIQDWIHKGSKPEKILQDYEFFSVNNPEKDLRLSDKLNILFDPKADYSSQSAGSQLIRAERLRQISEEGYTKDRDSRYIHNELIDAAIAYCIVSKRPEDEQEIMVNWWPWDKEHFKPSKNKTTNIKKAGALLAAEIDRNNHILKGEPNDDKD